MLRAPASCQAFSDIQVVRHVKSMLFTSMLLCLQLKIPVTFHVRISRISHCQDDVATEDDFGLLN